MKKEAVRKISKSAVQFGNKISALLLWVRAERDATPPVAGRERGYARMHAALHFRIAHAEIQPRPHLRGGRSGPRSAGRSRGCGGCDLPTPADSQRPERFETAHARGSRSAVPAHP